MIFGQITHDNLCCASYLVDKDAGVGAGVDPKLDSTSTYGWRATSRVSIEHILETHNHADHVSCHGQLAAATGATIHIHEEASPDYQWAGCAWRHAGLFTIAAVRDLIAGTLAGEPVSATALLAAFAWAGRGMGVASVVGLLLPALDRAAPWRWPLGWRTGVAFLLASRLRASHTPSASFSRMLECQERCNMRECLPPSS